MCLSSSKRRASLAIGILEFRIFITPFNCGETSSIVLSSLPSLIKFWPSYAWFLSSSSSSMCASFPNLPRGDKISASISACYYSAISLSTSGPFSAAFIVISFFWVSARAFFFSFCFSIWRSCWKVLAPKSELSLFVRPFRMGATNGSVFRVLFMSGNFSPSTELSTST